MGDVIEEMLHHVPEGFMGHHIFLPTVLAVLALYNGATIKTILLCSLGNMRHSKFLLKNKYKKIQEAFLFRYCTIKVTLSSKNNHTGMKILLLSFLLFLSQALTAQYYYNDIVGTRETNELMKNYTANKVRTVSATGFDNRGSKATDFSELQEIKENGKALRNSSITNFTKTVTYSRFDNMGRVVNVVDSSAAMQSTTTYSYDAAGRVVQIQNTVADSSSDFNHTETHSWQYSADGKPERMWRIINSSVSENSLDSVEIRFIKDEDGNIGEERTFKKGMETGYLYYYYDDQNRLLDIVRYNTRLKKLLPDIMFEYDAKGNLAQKTTTTSSLHLGYLIWRYIYDEKGLKTKEVLFNNEKQITGRIEYNYTFGQ
jgi:YD repeat-containing protein